MNQNIRNMMQVAIGVVVVMIAIYVIENMKKDKSLQIKTGDGLEFGGEPFLEKK